MKLVILLSGCLRQKYRVTSTISPRQWPRCVDWEPRAAAITHPRGAAFRGEEVLEGGVLELPREAGFILSGCHPGGFAGVRAFLQKVGYGNSAPCQSNCVRLDTTSLLRETSLKIPDSVHLKDLDHWGEGLSRK